MALTNFAQRPPFRAASTLSKEVAMVNSDQIAGKTDQLTGKIKQMWGRLTDDEIALANGKRDEFFGKVRERYGLEKEEAQARMKELEDSMQDSATHADRAA